MFIWKVFNYVCKKNCVLKRGREEIQFNSEHLFNRYIRLFEILIFIIRIIWILSNIWLMFNSLKRFIMHDFWELCQKLQIWHVSTHSHVVSENTPISTKAPLILLISALFCKKSAFFGKNNTFTQTNSMRAVLEIF